MTDAGTPAERSWGAAIAPHRRWALWAMAPLLCCCRSPQRSVPSTPDDDTWVEIRPGTTTIGSAPDEPCRDPDEDRIEVEIKRGFFISAHEVTQRAFERARGYNPSFRHDCPDCPVDSVTHDEAAAYCNVLSSRARLSVCYRCQGRRQQTACQVVGRGVASCNGYRLPTEAEWEYASRAGTQTSIHAGRVDTCMTTCEICNAIAWYKVTSAGRSHPVGQKAPNPWGLYDMHGNVYEWTSDWYTASRGTSTPAPGSAGARRVLRGGSWYHNAEHLRSANRMALRPNQRLSYVGFRCVRSR